MQNHIDCRLLASFRIRYHRTVIGNHPKIETTSINYLNVFVLFCVHISVFVMTSGFLKISLKSSLLRITCLKLFLGWGWGVNLFLGTDCGVIISLELFANFI